MENYTEEFIDVEEEFRKAASKGIQNSKMRYREGIIYLNESLPENNINSEYESQELINRAGESFAFSSEMGLKSNIFYDDFRKSQYFNQTAAGVQLLLDNERIEVPKVGSKEWHKALAAESQKKKLNLISKPDQIRKYIIMENDPTDERVDLTPDPTDERIILTPEQKRNDKFLTLTYERVRADKISGHSLYTYYQLQDVIPKSLQNLEYYCYVDDEIKYTIYALLTEDILSRNQDGKTIMPRSFMENLDTVKNAAVNLRYASISLDGLKLDKEGKSEELDFLRQFSSAIVNVGEYRFPLPKVYAQIDFEKYKFENFFANNITAFQNLDKMTKYYIQSCFTKKEIEAFIQYINIDTMDSLTLNVFVNNAIYLKNFVKNRMQIDLEFTEKQFARVSLICNLLKAFQPFDPDSKRLCDNEAFATEEKKQFYIDKVKELVESKEKSKHIINEEINILKEKYPYFFNPKILKIRSEEEITKILLSEEFKKYPELFTPDVLIEKSFQEMQEIIASEEFKKYPKLFTLHVLTKKSLREMQEIIASEEFKKYPELFTPNIIEIFGIATLYDITSNQMFKSNSKNIIEFILTNQKDLDRRFFVEGVDWLENDVNSGRTIDIINAINKWLKLEYEVENLDNQILIFIEMINKDKSGILISGNQETLEGYPDIKLSDFWGEYKEDIKYKLFIELRDNPMFYAARQTILNYYEVNSYEELESFEKRKNRLREARETKSEIEETIISIDEHKKGKGK